MNIEIVKGSDRYRLIVRGEDWLTFAVPLLQGGLRPQVIVRDAGDGWTQVRLRWTLPADLPQDEVAVQFAPTFTPDFWWGPHLSPSDGDCMPQHVFRSPAMIVAQQGRTVALVPDLDVCGQNPATPWFMDYSAPENKLWLGLSKSEVWTHVGYRKAPGMVLPAGTVELSFFITAYTDADPVPNPWARVTRFLWTRYAHPLFEQGQPGTVPMDAYVQHVYHWAFTAWREAVWQEFDLSGVRVGAPAFIVNVTQSPNYPGQTNLREYLSIWNQAWFSCLRGASGVMRYAQRTQDAELRNKAELTKELALAAPCVDGIFPSVYRTEMEELDLDGEKIHRSKGWQTGYWTNSDRMPWDHGITDRWYHVLDASWTSLLMLRWYDELEADPRLLDRARVYADKLLTLQDARGFFPAWLDPETLKPSEILADSPETSMSVTFLLKLAALTSEPRYRAAALKAMDAVIDGPLADGRWEDFETYWSCSGFGREHLGRRFERNAMYKQCNFSMYWTAEALLEAHRATGEARYLAWGRRTLDELAMTQQSWQPPFIYIPALGGFGVMNFDGEWNDSRQCLFAELFMQYYQVTGESELFERGIAALKAGFVMMYCPENPEAKALWEKVWPFFGPEDYGFTMENYGHGGAVNAAGEGIGEFTIYDWGNGAAAEARNRVFDHFGDVYIDRSRRQAFGIDSVAVDGVAQGICLRDLANMPRTLKLVYDDGTVQSILLNGTATLPW